MEFATAHESVGILKDKKKFLEALEVYTKEFKNLCQYGHCSFFPVFAILRRGCGNVQPPILKPSLECSAAQCCQSTLPVKYLAYFVLQTWTGVVNEALEKELSEIPECQSFMQLLLQFSAIL